MKKEFDFNKDESKGYQYDFENLKVGDIVFEDSTIGFCASGFVYGIGERVVKITDSLIKTIDSDGKRSSWDINNKMYSIRKNTAYYLAAYQSRS